jgi:predicted RNase H-like HicB family nuclease
MAVAMPLRTYRVVLDWDAEWPGWAVSVPALPGCFTQGKTEAEALGRAQEAISGHLAALADIGAPIPPPDVEGPAVTVVGRP